jgi:hypothetical protein
MNYYDYDYDYYYYYYYYYYYVRTGRAGFLEKGGSEEGEGDERQAEQFEQDEVSSKVVVEEEVELERGTECNDEQHRPCREEHVRDHPRAPVHRILLFYLNNNK